MSSNYTPYTQNPLRKCTLLLQCVLVIGCVKATDTPEQKLTTTATIEQSSPETNALSIPPALLTNGGAENPASPLHKLQGIKGVKVDQLFSENVRDTNDRVQRLEDTVTNIYRDIETMKPSIIRLIALEGDIEQLVTILSNETNVPAAAPEFPDTDVETVETEELSNVTEEISTETETEIKPKPELESDLRPEPEPEPDTTIIDKKNTIPEPKEYNPEPQVKTPASELPSSAQLSNIRIGQHPDFTRIVLDTTQDITYDAFLNSDTKTLSITLPKISHTNLKPIDLSSSQIIEKYTVQSYDNVDETMLIFSFKHNVKIIKQTHYYDKASGLFKIFIDINALEEHVRLKRDF